MPDNHANFLTIPNWHKYQPKLKNGKPNREWVRLQCNLEDDPAYDHLSDNCKMIWPHILRLCGRTGRNIPYDAGYIRRALGLRQCTSRVVLGWVDGLVRVGLLVFSNQQNIEELATQDKTGQDKTIQPPKVPRKQKALAGYTERFEQFWKMYPATNGSKAEAFKEWKRQGCENGHFEDAMEALKLYLECPKWKDGYIKHARTWLHGRMWEVPPDMTRRGGFELDFSSLNG